MVDTIPSFSQLFLLRRRASKTPSGYFVFRKGASLESNIVVSYCDMGKEPFQQDIETTIGKLRIGN